MSHITFQFDALDRRGARTRGVLTAPNRNEAYRKVCAVGLQPLRIKPKRGGLMSSKRITGRDLAQFTQEFAVLMRARIPIVDGLLAIAEQETNPRLRQAIQDVASNVTAGSNLSEALAMHRAAFGEVYVETVRAAERTGNMNEALSELAEMLEREYVMRKGVKAALIYPVCILIWIAVAVSFLLIAIVPKFATMFADRGIDLPLPTQILVTFSGLMVSAWPVLLVLIAAGVFAFRRGWKRPEFRKRVDGLLHRIPLVREILRGLAVGRFAQILGLSIRSGLSLIEALEMAGKASGRPLLMADATRMADQVKEGGRLSDVLLTCSYLPPLARRMLTAGEEAAELPRMCSIIGDHCEREVKHLAQSVTDLIEPLLIVVLAGVVLLIALAIFLPMWNMTALIG